jgi:putative ABC transport system ATP-binding protein
LDSATTAEILDLLDDLHARGLTILLVTHDREVGERAERVVTMRDGRIVEDRHRS